MPQFDAFDMNVPSNCMKCENLKQRERERATERRKETAIKKKKLNKQTT